MENTDERSSVKCNPHPDAPHGFLRDASHNEGRYVCECEFWEPQEHTSDKEKLAQWMIKKGYATGHGDTIEDLLQELDWQIAENWNRALIAGITTEREACAKLVEILIPEQTEDGLIGHTIAKAIRERGEQ